MVVVLMVVQVVLAVFVQ